MRQTFQKNQPAWLKPENLRWAAWGWDHPLFYRRLGAYPTSFFGNSRWCDAWWRRIHSEEAVQMLADCGINAAVIHFFKGMGFKAEAETIAELKTFVPLLHRHGIKAVGYCLGTIFSEFLPLEEPEALNWVQRDYDGKPVDWCHRYYRYMPCMNTGYLKYSEKVINFGLRELELDGLHFDNCYAPPCYCPNCRKLFRAWLETHHQPADFALPGFDCVEPPPPGASTYDPLVQAWAKFRSENYAANRRRIYEYIKALNPEVCVMSNTGFPAGNYFVKRSIDPQALLDNNDLVWLEAFDGFPGKANGEVVSWAPAFSYADRSAGKLASTAWEYNSDGQAVLPSSPERIRISLLETAVRGNAVGINWPLRSTGGTGIAIDDAGRRDAVRDTIAFLDGQRELFADAVNPAKTALLYSRESHAFDYDYCAKPWLAAMHALLSASTGYRLLYSDELEQYGEFDTIIVPYLRWLPDAEAAALAEFERRGGRLLILGASGERDGAGLPRVHVPFSGELCATPEALAKLFPRDFTAPPEVRGCRRRLPDGSEILHLIDYDQERIEVEVTLHAAPYRIYTFDGRAADAPGCKFRFRRYCAVEYKYQTADR